MSDVRMCSLRRREVDREHRSLARPIVHADRSPVAGDDLPGDAQPQARSLAVRLCRHPRVEDVSQQLGRNPAAGVFDLETEPIVHALETDRQLFLRMPWRRRCWR